MAKNEFHPLLQLSHGNFHGLIPRLLVTLLQVPVNGFGLFEGLIPFVIADIDFLPGGKQENLVIHIFPADVGKNAGIIVAKIIHISHHIGNPAVNKYMPAPEIVGVQELLYPSLQQELAEEQWFRKEKLGDALLLSFQSDLAGDLVQTVMSFLFQFPDDGGFSRSGSPGNDYFSGFHGANFALWIQFKKSIFPPYLCTFIETQAMENPRDPEEFYKKLRSQLYDTSLWPTIYLYKFIVPTGPEKILKLEKIFDNMGAVITTKKSRKGNYTSVSVNVRMKDPDAVIDKYKEVAAKVEGVISL